MSAGGSTATLQPVAASTPVSGGAKDSPQRRVVRVVQAPAFCLAVVVTLSTLLRGFFAVRVPSPSILPDELLYSELGRSVARGAAPAVRGVTALGWGEVYPTLIAPAWLLFDEPGTAYHAALAINCLLMSLAAAPAYLLARLFVSRRLSLLVATLTILVPSMTYTGVVMTENAFYPVFLLAILLIARAVRWPTTGNQLLALAGLALATLTRIQGVTLGAAYAGAVVAYAFVELGPRRRAYLRRFVVTAVVALSVAGGALLVSVARGGGPFGWLGERSSTLRAIDAHEAPVWFVLLVADLVLYVAVAPMAGAALLLGRGLTRRAPEPVHLFGAVAGATMLATLVTIALVSAAVDVDGFENLNERYIFYVVPLAFIGLALWAQERSAWRSRWAWPVVGAFCVIALALPVGRLGHNARFQSPSLLPWLELSAGEALVSALIAVFVLTCGAVWLSSWRQRVVVLWLVTCGWMGLASMLAVDRNAWAASVVAGSYEGQKASWVDGAVPNGEAADVIWDQRGAPRGRPDELYGRLLITEFFNRSVGDVYRLGGDTHYENVLPTSRARLSAGGVLTNDHGRPIDSRYVLTTCKTRIAGEIVATASRGRIELIRVEPPLRLVGRGRCR